MLDEESCIFYGQDKEIKLSFYETLILSILILNKYKVVTYEKMIKEVYLEEPSDKLRKNVQIYVCRLRQKLKGYVSILKKVKVGYYLEMR